MLHSCLCLWALGCHVSVRHHTQLGDKNGKKMHESMWYYGKVIHRLWCMRSTTTIKTFQVSYKFAYLFTHSKSRHHQLCNLCGTIEVTWCTWRRRRNNKYVWGLYNFPAQDLFPFFVSCKNMFDLLAYLGTLSYQLWCSHDQISFPLLHGHPYWRPSGPVAESESHSSDRSQGAWTPERRCWRGGMTNEGDERANKV